MPEVLHRTDVADDARRVRQLLGRTNLCSTTTLTTTTILNFVNGGASGLRLCNRKVLLWVLADIPARTTVEVYTRMPPELLKHVVPVVALEDMHGG